MAFAAMIGPLISGIASIAGAVMSASAQSAQADQQEQVVAWNAARDREQAAIAQSKGAVDSYNQQRKGEQAAAQARAGMAQGGADTTEGTPLLLAQKFASETKWRENLAMADAQNQQHNLENKASAEEYQGQVSANASRSSASASLLSGFAGGIKTIGSFGASGGFG